MNTHTATKYIARFDGSVDLTAPAEVAFGDEVAFSGVARVVAAGLREGLFGDVTHAVTLDVRSLAGIATTAPAELEAPVDEPEPVQAAPVVDDTPAAPAPRRRLAWLREDIACPRWALLLAVALATIAVLTGCGSPTATTPTPSAPLQDPTLNATHVAFCAALQAKADDETRTEGARAAAQAEHDQRCQDVPLP